jgi:transcriptional regulator with XRE-family HTH domain
MMDTRTKIRLMRTAKGLKQTDLAERTGIAVRDISAIESGQVERWEQRLLEALGYAPEMDTLLNQLAGNGELVVA